MMMVLEFLQISNNQIANAFYDEDWEWFKDAMGFTPKNHADAERKIEDWKKKNAKYQKGDHFLIPIKR
jgi:hypothetical protein